MRSTDVEADDADPTDVQLVAMMGDATGVGVSAVQASVLQIAGYGNLTKS